MATLSGDTSDNTISGSNSADTIYGLAGDDTIKGFNGDDTLIGGSGDDTLSGNNNDDTFNFNFSVTTGLVQVGTKPVLTSVWEKTGTKDVFETVHHDAVTHQEADYSTVKASGSFTSWMVDKGYTNLDAGGDGHIDNKALTESQLATNYTAWLTEIANTYLKAAYGLTGGDDGVIQVGLNQNGSITSTPYIEGMSQADLDTIFGDRYSFSVITGTKTQTRTISDDFTVNKTYISGYHTVVDVAAYDEDVKVGEEDVYGYVDHVTYEPVYEERTISIVSDDGHDVVLDFNKHGADHLDFSSVSSADFSKYFTVAEGEYYRNGQGNGEENNLDTKISLKDGSWSVVLSDFIGLDTDFSDGSTHITFAA